MHGGRVVGGPVARRPRRTTGRRGRRPPRRPAVVTGDREPGAGTQRARRRPRRRAARPAGGAPPAGGGGASTSRPSDPARWATTVSGRRLDRAATSATAASGVAITSRSTPSAARGRIVIATEQRAPSTTASARARSSDPPGPGRSHGAREDGSQWVSGRGGGAPAARCEPTDQSGPMSVTWPSACSSQSSATRSGARSASGASTNRRSRIRGWGTWRSGSSTVDAVDRARCRRRGCAGPHRSSRTRSAAASRRWHTPSSSTGVRSVSSSTTTLR